MQFGQRVLLGLGTHPGKLLNVRGHGLLHLAGHGLRLLLHLRTKRPADELLAESFAELPIDQPDATLPARPELRDSAQRLAEEIEVLVHKGRGQKSGGRMDRVPAQVILNVIEAGGLKLVVEFFIERWFGYVECVLLTKPGFLEIDSPVETGRERLHLRQVHFVIEVVRFAALDAG